MRRLTLIGYRASGKSTVGRLAAARLGWPFVDADTVVEARLGMPIARFFAQSGAAAFRDHEAAALVDLLASSAPLVLATGGGAVLREASRDLLRTSGGVIAYLEAPAAYLAARLSRDAGQRPSLTGKPVAEEVAELLAEREPLYRQCATVTIDATRSPAQVADALVAAVENFDESRAMRPAP